MPTVHVGTNADPHASTITPGRTCRSPAEPFAAEAGVRASDGSCRGVTLAMVHGLAAQTHGCDLIGALSDASEFL
jgi:hypothetical protein